MLVTNNLPVQKQPTKSVSTSERVMASTMSVDEYFDELISRVHEDYIVSSFAIVDRILPAQMNKG